MNAPSFEYYGSRSGVSNASYVCGLPSEASTHTASGSERPSATATYSNSSSSGGLASGTGFASGKGSDGDPATPEREPTERWFPDQQQTQRWLGTDHASWDRGPLQQRSPPPLPRQSAEPRLSPSRRQAGPGQPRRASSPQAPSRSSSSRPHPVSHAWGESRQFLPPQQNGAPSAAVPDVHVAPPSQSAGLLPSRHEAAPLWEGAAQQRCGQSDGARWQHASMMAAPGRSAQHRHEMFRGASPTRDFPATDAEQFDQEAMALCGMAALLQAPAQEPRPPRPSGVRARTPPAPQEARGASPILARRAAGSLQVPMGPRQRIPQPIQQPIQQQPSPQSSPQRRAPQQRVQKKKEPERCLQCRQEPSSYLDHTCPKCGALVCAACLDDFRMIAKSYRCPRCGDEESNQERLQRNLWMMGAVRSTKLAFGALGQSIHEGLSDLFTADEERAEEMSTALLPALHASQYSDTPSGQSSGYNNGAALKDAARQNPAHAGDGVCSGPTYTSRQGAQSQQASRQANSVMKPDHRTRPPPDWRQGAGAGISSLFGIGGNDQEVYNTRLLNV